jgi:Zinc finger, C2H2 type
MLSDRNELTFRVNMLFRPMGESDKTFKHSNDWTDHHQPAAAYSAAAMPSTSASSLAHGQHSWLAPSSHFAFSSGPVTTSLPQQAPAAPAPRFTPTTTALPSYQGWSGYDFHNNHLDPVQSHIMSAPTTPMTEDGPPVSYIQGHQHPYAVSPSYATLTGRRDQPRNDTLHHQSPEHYDYDRQQQHAFQTWDYQHHAHHSGGESPSSEHFYPPQDDYRKSTVAASGMPMMTSSNNTTTPPPVADYQYSPNLGDESPSPISNSYPTTSGDYLSYHEDDAPKHARRYSIGGGMITAAPHNTNMPSYPPYMKAYHYKVPLTERPYKCDKCPQSFNRNHDLKRHKRIHLSVKPFPCQTCDKQFSRKDALKRHILVKRCGQPLPPDGRRSSNHQNVSRSTSGVSNNRNKSGALDLTDQYANATMAPPY